MSKETNNCNEEDLWLPENPARTINRAPKNPNKFDENYNFAAHSYQGNRVQTLMGRLVCILYSRQHFLIDPAARPIIYALALMLGIFAYHKTPEEPIFWVLGIIASSLGAIAIKYHYVSKPKAREFCLLAALLFTGMFVAQAQMLRTHTQIIQDDVIGSFTASVLEAEARTSGERLELLVHDFSGLERMQTPVRIRLSNRVVSNVYPGQLVKGRAQLRPHSGPAYIGGYNFGFRHFFDERVAIGFSYGALKPLKEPSPHIAHAIENIKWRDKLYILQSKIRFGINLRVDQALSGQAAAIAKALLTGQRQSISDETNNWLRSSGLAHILAISGLHMSLLAGTVLLVCRSAMAWHGGATLYYPSKKISAGISLAFVLAYLFISGSSLATQRAFITIAVMLIAILLDRRALSLRNVAIAAMIIMIIQPSAVFEAGFHMSFAAVAALISAHNLRIERQKDMSYTAPKSLFLRVLYSALTFLSVIAMTSLIAGLASGLFAAWHFQRIAPLSIAGNILALPIVTLLIMPCLLLSMILSALGIGSYALKLAGQGIEFVLSIAQWISAFSPYGFIGAMPWEQFAFFIAGFLIAICLHKYLKLLSLITIAIGFLPLWREPPPDVLLSESGSLLAVRAATPKHDISWQNDAPFYKFNSLRRDRFTAEIWLKAFAPIQLRNRLDRAKMPNQSMQCDDNGCTTILPNGELIAWINKPDDIWEACYRAQIIIANFSLGDFASDAQCASATIIERQDMKSMGAISIYLDENNGTRIKGAKSRNNAIARHLNRKKSAEIAINKSE